MKASIARMEEDELEKWVFAHEQKQEKKRELYVNKQKQEMLALQVRLENSL